MQLNQIVKPESKKVNRTLVRQHIEFWLQPVCTTQDNGAAPSELGIA
jgi:hypothetical protein